MNFDTVITELNNSNTTWEFQKIYSLLKLLIDSGVSIKDIDNNCSNLTAYKIIDYLVKYGEDDINNINAIKNYYNSLQINQDRCLVIADTHIGRLLGTEKYNKSQIFENERGLYYAYNHALKENINNVIHLGDLLEGDSDRDQYRIYAYQNQLEYLERVYPHINNIKTYLLYGNHDYNLIYYDNVDSKFYKVCNNMELIGVNDTYINFCNQIIKLSHYCKTSDYIKNIELPHDIELSGHSHMYCIYEEDRFVRIPSLSSAVADKDGIGFIEMVNEENNYLLKYFDQNGNEVKGKEKVLNKKNTI